MIAYILVFLWKVNFSEEVLHENIGAFVHALLLAKPAGLKKSKCPYIVYYFFCGFTFLLLLTRD
jgi:ribosomal protein L1